MADRDPGKDAVKRATAEAFAKRLLNACDANPSVPPLNFGRLGWIRDRFKDREMTVSLEGVRKWFAGLTVPRPAIATTLAEILGVDAAWLLTGKSPEVGHREQKLRDAEVDGVVNVIAGLIQMDGGNPAFPEKGEKGHVDVHAIIRGARYAFHVALAQKTEDGVRFSIPRDADDAFILGVVRRDGFGFDLVEIDREVLRTKGSVKGVRIEIAATFDKKNYFVDGLGLKRVKSFSERL